MAQLGLYRKVVLDSTGAPLSGASVEIRRQGATVLGDQGLVSTINVNDPGGIIAGDTVNVNADTGSSRSVSSVTASTVVVGLGIALSLSDDDRITIVTALPTLYNDSQGVETKANPLTTDSNGAVYCYLPGRKYDVKISGSSITTQLLADEGIDSSETFISNLHPSATGTASAFIFDTARTLSAGDNVLSVRHTGSEVFFLSKAGNLMATGSGTLGGAVLLGSTLTVTSGASISGCVYVGGTFETTSTLNVQGAATFASSITANSNCAVTGALSVGGLTTSKRLGFYPKVSIATGATSIDADLGSYFLCQNTAVTTIDRINNGLAGQLVVVHINDTFTYWDDGARLALAGSVDFHSSTKGTHLGFIVSTPGSFNFEIFRTIQGA